MVPKLTMIELEAKQKDLTKILQLYEIAITQQEKKIDKIRRGKLKFAQVSDQVLYALFRGDLKRLQTKYDELKEESRLIEETSMSIEVDKEVAQTESEKDEQLNDTGLPPLREEGAESFSELAMTQTPSFTDTSGLGRDVNPDEFSIEEDQLLF